MAFVSSSFSNRKLQNRRFTSDALTLSVEAFTDTLDLSAGEIYTDDGLIPSGSSQLPYSGSDQDGFIVSGSVVDSTLAGDNDVNVLKYYYRKKLTVGANASRDTFYVLSTDPATATTTVADIGGSDQIISDNQLTNFISPKYIVAVDAANNTETSLTPGYSVVISAGADASSATVIGASKYVFDYKTGVLSFIDASDVGASDYVFISAYQYIGRTLRSQIDDGSIGGGGDTVSLHFSASEGTGFSFANNATASFESGSAGITVTAGATNTITIGASTDDVTFNSVTSDNLYGTSSYAEKVVVTSNAVHTNDYYSIPFYSSSDDGVLRTDIDEKFGFNPTKGEIILGAGTSHGTNVALLGSTALSFDNHTNPFRFQSQGSPNGGFEFRNNNGSRIDTQVRITGSLLVTGSGYVNGNLTIEDGYNLIGTSSWATNAISIDVTNDASTNQAFGLVFADGTGSGVNLKSHEQDLTYNPGLGGGSLVLKAAGVAPLTITNTGILPTNNGNFNIGTTGNLTTIRIGHENKTVEFLGSASIAGDLTVQGTVTSIQTENLNVSDQFILLASGSTGTKDGGIIVQSGSNGVGTALYFDANANRWAVNPVNSVNWNDTALTPKQYVVSVSASAAGPTTDPQDFGSSGQYYGMMHVNTDNGEIWIYS